MEELPKKSCGISTYDKWNIKPQVSSIFHFDRVSEGWMAYVLCANINRLNYENLLVCIVCSTYSHITIKALWIPHYNISILLFQHFGRFTPESRVVAQWLNIVRVSIQKRGWLWSCKLKVFMMYSKMDRVPFEALSK